MILSVAPVATRLGDGDGVDIPVGRIVLALLACILIAFFAIILLRERLRGGEAASWLRRLTPKRGVIDVVEVRRLSVYAEIGVVRHDGREYLMLLQAGANTILRETDVPVLPQPERLT